MDLGIQAYIPDLIEERDGATQSGETLQLQNMVESLSQEIELLKGKNSQLSGDIMERESLVRRLSESIRIGNNQMRVMEENIEYLNLKVDDLTEPEVTIIETKKPKGITKRISRPKNPNPHIKQIKSEYSVES